MMEFEFKKKVLLVADDTDFLDQMKIEFEDEADNLEVIPVSSVDRAFKCLEKEDFDVIVSEFQNSDGTGIEFLKEVREEKKMDIPFILFNNKKKPKITLKALNAGTNRVLNKGEDVTISCKILNQVIEQETLHYKWKKEVQQHRSNFDNDIVIF